MWAIWNVDNCRLLKLASSSHMQFKVSFYAIVVWITSEASRFQRVGCRNWKGWVLRGPWRGRNGFGSFLWTSLSDPYPYTALATRGMCSSVTIWFLAFASVQNLESSTQQRRKIGVQKWRRRSMAGMLTCFTVTLCTKLHVTVPNPSRCHLHLSVQR